jgi:hypothetical protein
MIGATMKFAVIDGGYEQHMQRIAERVERETVRVLGYMPNVNVEEPDLWKYAGAKVKQRRERDRRRCDVAVAGDCIVLKPGAFKSK